MSTLQGKVALVTGGGRGIGRAIVFALADAGATVAFTYKNSAAASEEMVRELTGKGLTVTASWRASSGSSAGSTFSSTMRASHGMASSSG